MSTSIAPILRIQVLCFIFALDRLSQITSRKPCFETQQHGICIFDFPITYKPTVCAINAIFQPVSKAPVEVCASRPCILACIKTPCNGLHKLADILLLWRRPCWSACHLQLSALGMNARYKWCADRCSSTEIMSKTACHARCATAVLFQALHKIHISGQNLQTRVDVTADACVVEQPLWYMAYLCLRCLT